MIPYTVFKTHTFKLRNITAKKSSEINKTAKQADMAYFKVLNALQNYAEHIKTIELKSDRKKELRKLKKMAAHIVSPLPFGGALKASIPEQVRRQVSSYVELSLGGQQATYHDSHSGEDYTDEAIDALANSIDINGYDRGMSLLQQSDQILKKSQFRPLNFDKYRFSDGFMLLMDDNKRLFAFLNLWGRNDKRARRVSINHIDVRTGERVVTNTKVGQMFPLELGAKHIQALSKGAPKSAILYSKDGEFYLAVSIEYTVPKLETHSVMGIDRGIEEIATYAVRATDGKVLESGTFNGDQLRNHQDMMIKKRKEALQRGQIRTKGWGRYNDQLIHQISNEIVKIALKHSAQVVLEDLSYLKNSSSKKMSGNKASDHSRRWLFTRQQYGRLERQLNYKLNFVGLPSPVFVNPANTSITCPSCGVVCKTNRVSRDQFVCNACSYRNHSDFVGGINIAGKRLWLEQVFGSANGKSQNNKTNRSFSEWQSSQLTL